MKVAWVLTAVMLLLTGCTAAQLERVEDVWQQPELPPPRTVNVSLPPDAALDAVAEDRLRSYSCSGYTLLMGTEPAGDLSRTVRAVSGYDIKQLSLLRTRIPEGKRYDFSCSTLADSGQQILRCAILDDGIYHYTVTVLADAAEAGSLAASWGEIYESLSLEPY